MGNWYAKPLFWRPQLVLFISESIILPVLSPLSPASTLTVRFPDDLAATLRAHGVPESFINCELDGMDDEYISKTNSRQVVGVLNEFARMATRMRELHPSISPQEVAVQLAEVPVGIYSREYLFPVVELRKLTSI